MKPSKLAPLFGVLLLAVVSCGCSKLKARDHLNKGVAAYKNAQFQAAIEHFKQAVADDPSLLMAKLYLATALKQLYIPEGDSPENIKIGKQAIEAFEEVLKEDPNNDTALASIAQTYYQMHDFDKAKEYQRRRLQVDPNNAEPYFWIGAIDWALAYKENAAKRQELKLNVPNAQGELPPLPVKAREEVTQKIGPLVDEGLKALLKELDLKPNHSDAMGYVNLMYRQKADLEADAGAREADLKQAGQFFDKSLALREAAAEKASK